MNITVHRECPPNHEKYEWPTNAGYVRAEDGDIVVVFPALLSVLDDPADLVKLKHQVRFFVQLEKGRIAR